VNDTARVWILVGTLFLLHFLLHVGFGLGAAAPDLLVIGLLIAAREVEIGFAAGLGFVFGILEDALSLLAFGANTLTLTTLGVLGAFTRDLFVGDSYLFLLLYFIAGKWLRDLIHWMLMSEEIRQPFVEQVLMQGLTGGLYAAAVGIGVLALSGLGGEG
jgi:cell shape-determining protein MreD